MGEDHTGLADIFTGKSQVFCDFPCFRASPHFLRIHDGNCHCPLAFGQMPAVDILGQNYLPHIDAVQALTSATALGRFSISRTE